MTAWMVKGRTRKDSAEGGAHGDGTRFAPGLMQACMYSRDPIRHDCSVGTLFLLPSVLTVRTLQKSRNLRMRQREGPFRSIEKDTEYLDAFAETEQCMCRALQG